MKKSKIEFKGSKKGLVIYLDDITPLSVLKEELINILNEQASFFKDAKVSLDMGSRRFTPQELMVLREIIESYDMIFNGISTEGKGSRKTLEKSKIVSNSFEREGSSLTIRRTLRSGQSVSYKGTIVILGDVNPGAEVVAEGDIIVVGKLKGIAHAGTSGDRSATVIALSLKPTQLRIADIISRSPDGEQLSPQVAEFASIKNDSIVVDPLF